MTIRPIGNRVLLSYEEAPTTSPGGIILMETAKKKPVHGTILAIGEGRLMKDGTYVQPDVKVGQRVMYDKFTATGIEHDGQKYVSVDVDGILGVYE